MPVCAFCLQVTKAIDIYSLGATMYHLLTKAAPHTVEMDNGLYTMDDLGPRLQDGTLKLARPAGIIDDRVLRYFIDGDSKPHSPMHIIHRGNVHSHTLAHTHSHIHTHRLWVLMEFCVKLNPAIRPSIEGVVRYLEVFYP
jgi:serine/threonine protein kinase